MTFKELAKIQKKALIKQPLTTIEEAREQVKWLKRKTTIKKKAK